MDALFVHADNQVTDATKATATLLEQAALQWGLRLDADLLPVPFPLWYKEIADVLTPCRADDPVADSHWWVFPDIPSAVLQTALAA